MFEMSHHVKISRVLNSLRTEFFVRISAYFGGGTLLTMSYDEYRQSMDIDFICPVGEGYREPCKNTAFPGQASPLECEN